MNASDEIRSAKCGVKAGERATEVLCTGEKRDGSCAHVENVFIEGGELLSRACFSGVLGV